ncbi:methyltransferase domain-containing protein [Rhodobacterales bacterium HKCCE4037]|nr:methyltransferase domain-containing protein [Rhodobacterales bacterium HKCCE4037]
MDRQTINIYEAEAARYAGLPITGTQRAAITRFLSMLPQKATILDAGCGPGIHAEAMLSAGHDVHGIDPTRAFVTDALSRGVNARLGTFDDISGEAIFDGIFASFSLLHAPRADLPRHLAAMVTALKPKGALFVGMKSGSGESRDRIGRRYTYVTELEMRRLLRDLGADVIHVDTGEEAGLSGEVAPYFLMFARGPADA